MVFGVVWKAKVRAADAKEVGVENPAEETFRYPNLIRRYADRMCCQRPPGCGLCNQLCSNPWSRNLSVLQFSDTVRTTLSGMPPSTCA